MSAISAISNATPRLRARARARARARLPLPTLLALLPLPALSAPTGAITGAVAGEARAIVYLEGAPGGRAPVDAGPEVRQRDSAFVPDVLVVRVGSTVAFPNDDRVFHNVFSVSEAAQFDLGLYKSGTSRSVRFERPGVVDVYCNIHPQMMSKILVLDTGWWTETAADGGFRFADVPPGTFAIVAWSPRGAVRSTVTVESDRTATVRLELKSDAGVARHLRKDGTPYGRYK